MSLNPLIHNKNITLTSCKKDEFIQLLLHSYGDSILRLAYSYVKDYSKAEDILQDTMLTIFLQLSTIREESALKSWVYRIAINKCKDYLKSWHYKHMRLNQVLFDTLSSTEKAIELKLVKKDETEELINNLLALPLKYREVIFLHYYEELSLAEMEKLLELKQSTIKSRLHYARLLLKKSLI